MLDSCRAVENEGMEVTYLPVKQNGIIDLQASGPSALPPQLVQCMVCPAGAGGSHEA